jgi:lipopolysaccharide transport system permease protein
LKVGWGSAILAATMENATLIQGPSRGVRYYLRPDHVPRTLWRHGRLLIQLVRRGVAARYRGSVLGLLWSIVLPLVMLMVYTFVFAVVIPSRWGKEGGGSVTDFALTMFCGLLLYSIFAETLNGAAATIAFNVSFVKKVVFPLEILPVVTLGTALVNGLISFGILLLGLLIFRHSIPLSIVYFPIAIVPLILLCLGLGWFLASVAVYLRDTGHVVTVILQLLFFMTPIFYSIDQIPPPYQFVMRLNPLSLIIENARRTVMLGQPPEWGYLLATTLCGLTIMQLGYVWFMKTKRGFADVL